MAHFLRETELFVLSLSRVFTHLGAGSLQGGADALQLLHPGQLQLAAGGGPLPVHAGEPLLLLAEEAPRLVHHSELG